MRAGPDREREGDKGRGEDVQERIKKKIDEKYGHFARVKRVLLSEGRRETRGGKWEMGGDDVEGKRPTTPPPPTPVNPSNMHNGYVYVQANT